MCHVSRVKTFFFIPKKIKQSGGAIWWRFCYQRGLPRLVSVVVVVFAIIIIIIIIIIIVMKSQKTSLHIVKVDPVFLITCNAFHLYFVKIIVIVFNILLDILACF